VGSQRGRIGKVWASPASRAGAFMTPRSLRSLRDGFASFHHLTLGEAAAVCS
jgi:hypothetical protein